MAVNPQLVGAMFAQDLDAAHKLHALLVSERELLESRSHDQLADLIDEKNDYLNLLAHHAGERRALLQSLSLDASQESWESLLGSDRALAAHLPLWHEVKTAIDKCKTLNEVNGKLIGRSQQTLRRLLDLVRGNTGAPQLYNASGTATGGTLTHTVAKA